MPTTPMTAHDRCDQCGAAAVVRFAKVGAANTLQFCGHHTRKNVEKLRETGWIAILGAQDAPMPAGVTAP